MGGIIGDAEVMTKKRGGKILPGVVEAVGMQRTSIHKFFFNVCVSVFV